MAPPALSAWGMPEDPEGVVAWAALAVAIVSLAAWMRGRSQPRTPEGFAELNGAPKFAIGQRSRYYPAATQQQQHLWRPDVAYRAPRPSSSARQCLGMAVTAPNPPTSSPGLTTQAMDRIARGVFVEDKRPVILFDGVCNLCNKAVTTVLDLDDTPGGAVRFAALQSKVGQSLLRKAGRATNDHSSIVLVDERKAWVRSDAVLRIARLLNVPLKALSSFGFLFPAIIRDGVYEFVADNRFRFFGTAESCRLMDEDYIDRFIEEPEDSDCVP